MNQTLTFSFRFYQHCEGYEPTLLLIRSTDGDVSDAHTDRSLITIPPLLRESRMHTDENSYIADEDILISEHLILC